MMDPVRTGSSSAAPVRVDEDVLRVVATRIAERAGEYGFVARDAARVRLRPYHSTSTYPLYLAEIPSTTGATARLVVKFAPIFGQHREGRAEFANLRAMAARLGPSGHLHVPRPFDYWEDVNALITEHRPGRRFSTLILNAPPWFASGRVRGSLARTSTQCGEWLRIYHDATARGEGPAIDERFATVMRRDLGRIPPRGPLHGMRASIERALDGILKNLAAQTAPVAVRHGDFCPDNIHVDGDGICVFDLSHHVPAPVLDDVAYFLVTLDTMNPYPRHPAFDRRVARALATPFLDGYYGAARAEHERGDAAVMAAYALKNLLTRCLKQRHVAAAAGPLALAAFDGLWVAGVYRGLMVRAMERAVASDLQ